MLCSNAWPQELLTRKDGETLRSFCSRILPEATEFAHPPLQLKIGPVADNIVVFYRHTEEGNENFTGWVLMPDRSHGGSYRKYTLPPMFEVPKTFTIDIKAVFGAGVRNNPDRNLVVLYEYHHNGRPQDSGYASYVFQWTGNDFQVRKKLWEALAGVRTAAAVRHKLRTLP